ncbi:hypothetical protein AB0I28_13100 [Phytomonospora sp. NPDC050363]|uniref:VOC family protein n=1 Tax=Phytomonospora sp. NPDC050363 TaxID=3155642 RepID=UPI0033E3D3BB
MAVLKTYARVYVDDLDAALPVLSSLVGEGPRWRESFAGLELAGLGGLLLIAGDGEALAPFRSTHATAVVDDLDAARRILEAHGAELLEEPFDAPNGRGFTARQPGGAIVEYVEWRQALREKVFGAEAPAGTIKEVYGRLYVDDLDTALPVLAALAGREAELRFDYLDLELAEVGGFLAVAGTPAALAPFRATHATAIVTDLAKVLAVVAESGGEVLDGPNEVPTGRNLTVRHGGGAIIEYVEFRE